MIEWWGPIIHEYYSGTEGGGLTWITSEQWLAHPGSVGAAAWGAIYICDDEGDVLPAGEDGVVWFGDRENTFVYNNDPEKTQQTFNERGWSTLWDVGHLDEDGYLYLTDRKLFMIVSGGVNIYPQEIEDVLVLHPSVADVAVFGIPDVEMGEQVKAVIQPAPGTTPGSGIGRRDPRLLPGKALSLQVPPIRRLHRCHAARRERQALQEAAPGHLLGRHYLEFAHLTHASWGYSLSARLLYRTPAGRNCTLTRGPSECASLGTECSQIRWQLPPMTKRSPRPSAKDRDRPPPRGRRRKRRGVPSETMATMVSSVRPRPTVSPCHATLSAPLR